MREIKFRYIFKTVDGRFLVEQPTLKEIEYGWLKEFLEGLHDIIIISKDQYTGLKDKNGKEIYEGDIVEHSSTVIPVCVKLTDQGEIFYGYTPSIKKTNYAIEYRYGYFFPIGDSGGENNMSEYEVIGNIHENSEMLK